LNPQATGHNEKQSFSLLTSVKNVYIFKKNYQGIRDSLIASSNHRSLQLLCIVGSGGPLTSPVKGASGCGIKPKSGQIVSSNSPDNGFPPFLPTRVGALSIAVY